MAHKVLVGGTAYAVKGGRTLIGGTGYSIKQGKTLIAGTTRTITFSAPKPTMPMSVGWYNSQWDAYIEVTVNGRVVGGEYVQNSNSITAQVSPGDIVHVSCDWMGPIEWEGFTDVETSDLWFRGTVLPDQPIIYVMFQDSY